MDIFKFAPSPTVFANGQLIPNLRRKTWIERYDEPGEFTLTANADSGLREFLPTGTAISHIDTQEVMVVENHEISESRGEVSELVITGRSLDSILDQRRVGASQVTFPTADAPANFDITLQLSWAQAVYLIKKHITSPDVADPNDAIASITVDTNVTGVGTSEARTIPRGSVLEGLREIMAVDSLGIKTVRSYPHVSANNKVLFRVHRGVDRTATIAFTYETDEIDNADYLWSNKSDKNAVLVTGKWVETMVKGPETGINRRVMHIDASDLDEAYTTNPVGGTRTAIVNAMIVRGNQALAAQKEVALIKAEANSNSRRYQYRVDYDLGDLVTVRGQYSESATRRIMEYVEIEDETGEYGQPTFSVP